MSKLNKQLIKAGLYYLIDHDEESFLERMSMYLQDKAEFMNFLFDGPLPINDNIKEKIEELTKICARQLDTILNAASWQNKYRELYTKYINLLRKRGQGFKNDKIKKKKEELDYSKKMALDRDVYLKAEQKNLIPFIAYIDHTASFATKNNWIVVSDVKVY